MPAAHSLCASSIQDHASAIRNFFLDSLSALKAPFWSGGDDVIGEGNCTVGKAVLINSSFGLMSR